MSDFKIRKHEFRKIDKIRFLYRQIYDAKESLHHCFSWSLLMSITKVFIDVVFFAFISILKRQLGIGESSLKEFLSLKFLCYTLLARVALMIAMTDRMSHEMKSTGLILAHLKDSSSDALEIDQVGRFKNIVKITKIKMMCK